MIFNSKAAQKNGGQKLTDHYLLNELWSDLDENSQAAVQGGNIGQVAFSGGASNDSMLSESIIVRNTLFDRNTNTTFSGNSAGSVGGGFSTGAPSLTLK